MTYGIQIIPKDMSMMPLIMAPLYTINFIGIEEYVYKNSIFFDNKESFNEALTLLDSLQENYPFVIETELIEEQNWNEVWENQFDEVEVDDFCLVRAPFHLSSSKKFQYEITIMPQMSFGTGHHATTWMMIQEMKSLSLEEKSVLDYGTGTGVLAILAKKMGASEVVGIDIDENSYRNAVENSERNNVTIDWYLSDIPEISSGQFDVILANINKNIIIQNIPEIGKRIHSGGHLLFSGFYDRDVDDISNECIKYNIKVLNIKTKENWALMHCLQL